MISFTWIFLSSSMKFKNTKKYCHRWNGLVSTICVCQELVHNFKNGNFHTCATKMSSWSKYELIMWFGEDRTSLAKVPEIMNAGKSFNKWKSRILIVKLNTERRNNYHFLNTQEECMLGSCYNFSHPYYSSSSQNMKDEDRHPTSPFKYKSQPRLWGN